MENPILRKLAIRLLVIAIVIGAYGLGVSNGTSQGESQQRKTNASYAVDDLNHDGKVTIGDLSIFLSHYNSDKPKAEKIQIQLPN